MDSSSDERTEAEKYVRIRLIRLKAIFAGFVTGIISALGIFVATNWLVIKGGPNVGPHLSLLGQYFIGYRVTFAGSLIGAAYAFALGFVCGYLVAHMYNWMAGIRDRHTREHGPAPH